MDSLDLKTNSPEETRRIAGALAGILEEGDFLALEGDLGAGKTCFVKGLARGLGAPGGVTSPTFSLIHEYLGGRLPLYHFDVYRLRRPEELEGLGYEEYFYGDGVCAVEWSDLIGSYLPADRLLLRFSREGGEDGAGGDSDAAEWAACPDGVKTGSGQAEPAPARRLTITAEGPRGRRLLDDLARVLPKNQQ